MNHVNAYNTIFAHLRDGLYPRENHTEFKADLKKYYNLEDNPKFEDLFRLSWDYGHAYGYSEVLTYFHELVVLVV
jgi:hypothetical protein